MVISQSIVDHVEREIIPLYDKCDAAHQWSHVSTVIARSLNFAEQAEVDPDVVYVAAAYHDIGCAIDRETHQWISARTLREDAVMANMLGPERMELAAQAVEDHRASSKHPPRSIYGKILSSADRSSSVDTILTRAWKYRKNIKDMTLEQKIQDAYNHITEKYGPGGRATRSLYFNDPDYDKAIGEIQKILLDYSEFRERFLAIANG